MRLALAFLVHVYLLGSASLYAGLLVTASDSHRTVIAGQTSSFTETLSLHNSGLEPVPLLVWQVGMAVMPETGATGAVEISSFGEPADYIFHGVSITGIVALPTPPPSLDSVLTDGAALALDGIAIPTAESRSILEITLSVAAEAVGRFRLVLLPFADGFPSSAWGRPPFPEPLPFENGAPDAGVSERTLLTIDVVAVPEPSSMVLALAFVGVWRFAGSPRRV